MSSSSNGSRRVRVIIAEDHPVYREGLVRAIRERPELELVGAVDNGRDALAEIREAEPEVAVLDVQMGALRGDEVLRALRREDSPTNVLVISADSDQDLVYLMIAIGAQGFLSKATDSSEICEAISRISRGETVLGGEAVTGLASEVSRREKVTNGSRLSDREQEVLRLVAEGHSAPDIGKLIHLSPATVKGHLHTLYEKLGVSDRAAAVATAMRGGYLE